MPRRESTRSASTASRGKEVAASGLQGKQPEALTPESIESRGFSTFRSFPPRSRGLGRKTNRRNIGGGCDLEKASGKGRNGSMLTVFPAVYGAEGDLKLPCKLL